MYLFEHTGAARRVVMVGSHNLTTNATAHQWNDLWVKNDDRALYLAFRSTFAEMKRDRNVRPSYRVYNIGPRQQLQVMPHPGTTPKNDPIMRILSRVRCQGATGGSGINGRTAIRVSQHHWQGRRGAWIARRLVELYAAGCDVKLMHGSADKEVQPALNRRTKRGLVPVRTNGFDRDGDTFLDVYSHHKYMTISGNYGGNTAARLVLTGSSNWAGIGMLGDELIFVVRGPAYLRQWSQNWNYIWQNHTQKVKYRKMTMGSTLPLPGGEHWEND
jgi:phosphatidylserine/phosphatidylglycerophosphate/cardiolipin synthase-like enzyme